MSTSTVVLITIAIIIIWITLRKSENAFDSFMKQKNYVFHKINKLLKKDMTNLLEALIKPMDIKCVKKTRSIESLEKLKTINKFEFDRLLTCGYVHNLFVITSLAVWEEYSKIHSETSLSTYIKECIVPIYQNPEFLRGTLDYTYAKRGLLECMNKFNI
jgi:hypothetical protein